MSEIEKKFFEAFGIEPKWDDCCTNNQFCKDKYGTKCTDRQCWFECPYGVDGNTYPPITSDIVLGLEEIMQKKGGFWLDVTTNTECWQYTSKRPKKSSCWFNNKKYALLNLCVQLKHEISEEVKALFKC